VVFWKCKQQRLTSSHVAAWEGSSGCCGVEADMPRRLIICHSTLIARGQTLTKTRFTC
jgi:hypothetical protein